MLAPKVRECAEEGGTACGISKVVEEVIGVLSAGKCPNHDKLRL